ncbi:MAG TPA: DUF2012 domain-containing protein, partial [Humisphaera sp.]|nr:DUF2012 domain-containing protein [Humisphaera sp.]
LADLLHTLGVLTRQTSGGSELRGHVALPSRLGRLDKLPPKIVLLSTLYSTVADRDGNFSLEHLPAGRYHLACIAPGGLFDTRDVEINAAGATSNAAIKGRARFSGNADVPVGIYIKADGDVGVPGKTRTPAIEIPAPATEGGLVRNPYFKLNWVSDGSPDGWYAVAKSRNEVAGWQGEWLPLERGQEYRLAIRWKPAAAAGSSPAPDGEVVVRLKKGLNSMLPIITGPAIARPTEEQRFTATPEKGDWAQIFIRTAGKPADIIEYIDLLPVRSK